MSHVQINALDGNLALIKLDIPRKTFFWPFKSFSKAGFPRDVTIILGFFFHHGKKIGKH